jgi:hypothetical protein
MNHTLSMTGHEGQIRWVYLPAIVFGPWRYESNGQNGGTLTAQIVSRDEFRVSQRPLVAVVPAGRAEWRWSVTDLQINGTELVASLVRQ